MKRQFLLLLIFVFAIITGTISAQENAEWEPQTNITGYLATQFEYFPEIKFFNREYGIAVTEAGILASYKPIEKLEIKTVFVYRPNYSIEQMINEANAEYSFGDFLKVKGGRFLTPLSPMNTYYYSPVNHSATLPMIITNHEFFPLNINGISANGSFGDEFKIGYDAFLGGFYNTLWLQTGAVGLFGSENNYFTAVMNGDSSMTVGSDANKSLQTGGGGHLAASYKDNITVGFGIFNSAETTQNTREGANGETITTFTYFDKFSYGANLKLKLNSLKLIGEYWQTKVTSPDFGDTFELEYKGGFVELSNNFGKITPYARYEYHSVPRDQDYNRYTLGFNYKPIFEITIKLEYLYYKYQELDQGGLVASLIYSF
jgi:hypothetical protein